MIYRQWQTGSEASAVETLQTQGDSLMGGLRGSSPQYSKNESEVRKHYHCEDGSQIEVTLTEVEETGERGFD